MLNDSTAYSKYLLHNFLTDGLVWSRKRQPICVSAFTTFKYCYDFTASFLYSVIVTGKSLDPQLNGTTQMAPKEAATNFSTSATMIPKTLHL